MKKFVIADIHGSHKGFVQCLEKSKFNKEEDILICLGDTADGWPDVVECFEELLTIDNLFYIMGNHDKWLYDWLDGGAENFIWLTQGGQASADSYNKSNDLIKTNHRLFLKNKAMPYLVFDNKLFTHAGFNRFMPIEEQSTDTLMWDRDLVMSVHHLAQLKKRKGMYEREDIKGVGNYDEIYLGHTTVQWIEPNKQYKPLNYFNFWMMDTGCGYEGRCTIMDIDTKEIFQSDMCNELYDKFPGRN